MVKQGDTIYVLNVARCIILPRRIVSITKPHPSASEIAYFDQLPNLPKIQVPVLEFRLDPSPSKYESKLIKTSDEGERFQYLFFSTQKLADEALANFALPQRIEKLKEKADKLHEEYSNIIEQVGSNEKLITEIKEKYNGK